MENKSFNSESRILEMRRTMSYITLMKLNQLPVAAAASPNNSDHHPTEIKFYDNPLEQCINDYLLVKEYLPTIAKLESSSTYMNGIILTEKYNKKLLLMHDGTFAEVDSVKYKPTGEPFSIKMDEVVSKYGNGDPRRISNLIDTVLNSINKAVSDEYHKSNGPLRLG